MTVCLTLCTISILYNSFLVPVQIICVQQRLVLRTQPTTADAKFSRSLTMASNASTLGNTLLPCSLLSKAGALEVKASSKQAGYVLAGQT